jgi:phosphoesterase RecJ-like protein
MNIYKEIVEEIVSAKNIVITAHRSPDGDSIGSSMGLYQFIQKLGKKVVVCHPDPAPEFLHWVENTADIKCFDEHKIECTELLLNADLVFCLDYNAPNRVGKDMEEVMLKIQAKKVMIDHHPHPAEDFCQLIISDTSACSTCELIFDLIEGSGNLDLLDERIGTPLYLGIMTDTGSFRFPAMKPVVHEILAKLLKAGVVHFKVHENVFDTNTLDRLKLRGFALSEKMEILPGNKIALISLSDEELKRYNYRKGDTEGLVNMALSVQGIQIAAFFAEKDGVVKISFRSKGDYFVNKLSMENFEGGGHQYAAGGISYEGLDHAVNKFKSLVNDYFPA